MNRMISLLFAFIAIILVVLIILPLSTNDWITFSPLSDDYTERISRGLWAECRLNGCVSFSEFEVSTILKVVRGFFFLAMLSSMAAAFLAVRQFVGKPDGLFLLKFTFVDIVVFVFLGMVLYTAQYSTYVGGVDNASWGYSFIIGWITFALSLISAILLIIFSVDRKKGEGSA